MIVSPRQHSGLARLEKSGACELRRIFHYAALSALRTYNINQSDLLDHMTKEEFH